MVDLGKIIQMRLADIGMSQAQFATEMGKQRQNIKAFLTKGDYTLSEIRQLNKVLEIDLFVYLVANEKYAPEIDEKKLEAVQDPTGHYHTKDRSYLPRENPFEQYSKIQEELKHSQFRERAYQREIELLTENNKLLLEKLQRVESDLK